MSNYFSNLVNAVISKSNSSYWDEAVAEWDIIDCDVDETCSSSCVCGKEKIKYLFTIKNRETNYALQPIGSKCINKFGRSDLNATVSTFEQLGKLYEAIERGEYIELSSEYFSRKLLQELLNLGAFRANQWNKFDPRNDYKFLLDVFNSKREPTERQAQKIKV